MRHLGFMPHTFYFMFQIRIFADSKLTNAYKIFQQKEN